MKKLYTLIVIPFLCSWQLSAQNLIPNGYFQNPGNQVCPLDSNQQIITFNEWEAYQTLNDEWWGPRDSSICLDLASNLTSSGGIIKLNQVDLNRRVFVRAKLDSTTAIPLNSNNLYMVEPYTYQSPGVVWNFGDSCVDGYCSGLMIGVQIPDTAGNLNEMRWYEGKVPSYQGFCVPTEYFSNGNFLREVIFKLKIESFDDPQDVVGIQSVNFMDFSFNATSIFSNTDLSPFYWGVPYSYTFQFSNYMFMHDATYPSDTNVTYIEFSPIPNTIDSQVVNIRFDISTYLLQPFTQLRGGLLDGDSIRRHSINIQLFGGDTVCMYPAVELVSEGGNQFTYHGGNVRFEGKGSCMLFGKGGKLVIADGATMNYGKEDNNVGMMALKTGGTIEIGKNAELVINNHVEMYEYWQEEVPNQIYMTLGEGAKLTFGKGSRLRNTYSKDGTMKLNIYMKGGVLDASGLSEKDRELINLIYDNPAAELESNITIYENPFKDNVHFSVVANEGDELSVQVYGLSGRLIYSQSGKAALQGMNFFNFDIGDARSGAYILKVESGVVAVSKKIVKL